MSATEDLGRWRHTTDSVWKMLRHSQSRLKPFEEKAFTDNAVLSECERLYHNDLLRTPEPLASAEGHLTE